MILIMITKFVGSIIRRKIKVTYKPNKPNLLSSIKRNKSWFEISCLNSERDSETNYSPPRPARVKATCQWNEKCLVSEKWLNNVKHLTHVLLPQSPRNILKHWCFKFYIRICWRCPERQWTCWLVPLLFGKIVEVYTIMEHDTLKTEKPRWWPSSPFHLSCIGGSSGWILALLVRTQLRHITI